MDLVHTFQNYLEIVYNHNDNVCEVPQPVLPPSNTGLTSLVSHNNDLKLTAKFLTTIESTIPSTGHTSDRK